MKERSGMPYDVVAFSTDEEACQWTNQEEGAFHRLMRSAWINGGIPDDVFKIAKICREPVKVMAKLWPAFESKWPIDPLNPERRVNPKQECEREFKAEKSGKAAESAAKSWESRRKAKAMLLTTDSAMRTHSDGNASLPVPPRPIPEEGKEREREPLAISSPVVPKYTSAFENFWEASTRRGSKLKAFGVWKRLGTFPQGELLAIYAAMVNWKNSEQWQDETKQPHISTWLGRRGWEELVPKRAIAENLRGGLIERQSLEHTTHFCGNCEVQHDWPCGELCTTGPGPRSCPEFVGRFTH